MADHDETKVVVTDVKIPFWSMVWLLVKVTIAAIPAYLILLAIGLFAFGLFTALVGGFEPGQ